MSDDTFTEVPKTHDPQRLALAQFCLALVNLLQAYDVAATDEDLSSLGVNFDGFHRRLDVAQLDAEGHLEEVILSLAADPTRPEAFAQRIGLTTMVRERRAVAQTVPTLRAPWRDERGIGG